MQLLVKFYIDTDSPRQAEKILDAAIDQDGDERLIWYKVLEPAAETTMLACLALGAQQYADPTPCYDAVRNLFPTVDWRDWIASVEAKRAAATREP